MKSDKDYACVSLRPGLQACKAAWLLLGERYLEGEAPSLPLAECDREHCDCGFNSHDDRREPGERRESSSTEPGRRHGRRHDDV